MYERITVLGAGSWGMAIARLLHNNGAVVTLWEFDQRAFEALRANRTQPEKLKDFVLPDRIALTNDLSDSVAGCKLVVLAVPSQALRSVVRQLRRNLDTTVGLVNLAKGIERGTLRRMSEVIIEELDCRPDQVAVLSGPSHAEEVAVDMPTAVVVAGNGDEFIGGIQDTFASHRFRVYKSHDLAGVELGGALKNIIAIAAGIADGLGMGDNSRGAIITRGLAEITRLGVHLGARAETFAGLSGIGDLVTTCTSRHSRNRYVGEKIGQGRRLQQVLAGMSMVAEGVETTRSGYELSRLHGVEMPITQEVYAVLFEDKPPAVAVQELMGRQLKAEIWR